MGLRKKEGSHCEKGATQHPSGRREEGKGSLPYWVKGKETVLEEKERDTFPTGHNPQHYDKEELV